MGGPAKYEGKAVEGVRIFSGGKIGEGAELGKELEKGIACKEDVLLPKLKEILIREYGAKEKAQSPELAHAWSPTIIQLRVCTKWPLMGLKGVIGYRVGL